MFRPLGLALSIALLVSAPADAAPRPNGPDHGALVIVGGGAVGPEIVSRFLELAGGPSAPIVVIPTAGGDPTYGPDWPGLAVLKSGGATNLTVLHTTDRAVADSETFVAPLRHAKAVWIPGGRQWRLADAYLGTRTEREIKQVLARGGVVGGTSAGASIQASYLVRGAPAGNEIMMSPGHEQGFGLLANSAIDQHVSARGRRRDLGPVIAAHPDLLGVGLDESTAIVVTRDSFEVIGKGKVYIHVPPGPATGEPQQILAAGDRFDLKTLQAATTPKAAEAGAR